MSSRKRSAVWNHFTEVDSKTAKCSYCSNTLCISCGNVGNLNRHLKHKHPTVSMIPERQHITPMLDAPQSEPVASGSGGQRPPQHNLQPPKPPVLTSMNDYLHNTKPLGPRRAEKIDEQLIKMIAKGHHPFSIVDEPEFKSFVAMLCPGYSLPTRKTLSESLVPKMYEREVERAKTKLQSGQAVCLTTDGWTSDNNDSFLAVTAHYIADSKLESTMLGCVEYAERHTAANLAEFLKKFTKDWDIEHKVNAVASDNAANVTAAIKTGQWRHIPCFAHSLNLCVQTALAAIAETTGRVKQVVEFFKRSSHAQSKLKDMQRQLDVPMLKLKQDVVTRWNSTYEMLRRFVITKTAVNATLGVTRPELILSNYDWQIVEVVVPILKIFSDVTVEISAERNVTLSKVIPLCSILIANAKRLLDEQQPTLELTTMVEILQGELERRFNFIEHSELQAEATLLDPRFKDVGFKDRTAAERAMNSLKLRVGRQRPLPNPHLDYANQPSTSTQQPELTTQTEQPSSLWAQFDQKVKKLTPINSTAAGIVELEKYMQEPMLSRTSDPFAWWHERRFVYPLLYNFMLKRLNVVATSVPCERIFSKAGNTLTERRRRLTTKKLSQLLFISCNT